MREWVCKNKIMNVDGVNKCNAYLYFPLKYNLCDNIYYELLFRIMLNCNKKYPKHTIYRDEYRKYYILNYDIKLQIFEDMLYVVVYFSLPKDGLIDNFSYESSLKFIYESLMNPVLDGFQFNYEKDFLLSEEDGFPRNIGAYIKEKFYNFVDSKEEFHIREEEYIKKVKGITPNDLVRYYNNAILNNKFFYVLSGDFKNDDSFIKTFKSIFTNFDDNIKFKCSYPKYLTFDGYKEGMINSKYDQSVEFIAYQFKNYSYKDILMFDVIYSFLVGQENNLVFNNLRIKNNLVYNCSVIDNNGCLAIVAFFNDSYKDKVEEFIIKLMSELDNEELFNKCMNKLIKATKYNNLDHLDGKYHKVNDYIHVHVMHSFYPLDIVKAYSNITYEDYHKFISRMVLSHKYYIKGGSSNE